MKNATKWSQIQKVLDVYDRDGDGQANWNEFWAVTKYRENWNSKEFKKFEQNNSKKNKLPEITMNMTNAEYKSACIIIYKAFAGTRGGIDFETFKNYYKKVRPWTSFTSRTSDKSWKRMFKVYDLDGNGFVTEREAWTRLKRN